MFISLNMRRIAGHHEKETANSDSNSNNYWQIALPLVLSPKPTDETVNQNWSNDEDNNNNNKNKNDENNNISASGNNNSGSSYKKTTTTTTTSSSTSSNTTGTVTKTNGENR